MVNNVILIFNSIDVIDIEENQINNDLQSNISLTIIN